MLLTSPGVKRGVVCVKMFRDIFGNILAGAFTVGQGQNTMPCLMDASRIVHCNVLAHPLMFELSV